MSDTTLHVRVSPGAKSSAVVGRHGTGWKVRVAAPPEGGRANAELIRLLAAVLATRERDVTLVVGERSRDKTVAIDGVAAAEVERRLQAAASASRSRPCRRG